MNATRNLTCIGAGWSNARRAAGLWCLLAALECAVAGARPDFGGREDEFRERTRREFEARLECYREATNNTVAAWEFGRAAFDLAEFARSKSERETLATQGVQACRRAVQLAPECAPAHYYLGLNLGQLARVFLLKGLGLVSEMEQAFLESRRLDPLFDYAGSDRILGLLYHQAPGWPISVGNQSKASRHLHEAVRLHPDYPGNRIALAAFLRQSQQSQLFTRQWQALLDLIPRAREEFSGSDWELSWVEWNHRIRQLRPRAEPRPD